MTTKRLSTGILAGLLFGAIAAYLLLGGSSRSRARADGEVQKLLHSGESAISRAAIEAQNLTRLRLRPTRHVRIVDDHSG